MQGHFEQGLWESGLVDTFLFYSGHLNEGVIGEASDRPLFLLCVLWEFETSDLWFDTSLSLQNSWAGAECGCWGRTRNNWLQFPQEIADQISDMNSLSNQLF